MGEFPENYTSSPTDRQKMEAEQEWEEMTENITRVLNSNDIEEHHLEFLSITKKLVTKYLSLGFGENSITNRFLLSIESYNNGLSRYMLGKKEKNFLKAKIGSFYMDIIHCSDKLIDIEEGQKEEYYQGIHNFTKELTQELLRKAGKTDEEIQLFFEENSDILIGEIREDEPKPKQDK